jgi:outer membrane protein TolC
MILIKIASRFAVGLLFVFLISACQLDTSKFEKALLEFKLPTLQRALDVSDGHNLGKASNDADLITNISYPDFTEANLKKNLKLALKNFPDLKSKRYQTDMAVAGIGLVEAASRVQGTSNVLSGARSENRTTEATAIATVSIGKVLYDFGSIDYSIKSQKEAVESAKLAELEMVETVAMQGIDAWVNLARNNEIETIFERGINLATPLLGQIKNISTSGLSDKTSLLAAKQKFSSLESSYQAVKANTLMSEAVFKNIFLGSKILNVKAINQVDFVAVPSVSEENFRNSLEFRGNQSLIRAKNLELSALTASKKPTVTLRANATIPVEEVRDEGVAMVGLDLTYLFNDGGLKKSKIDMLSLELESLREHGAALLISKESTLRLLQQRYLVAMNQISSNEDLLELASEVRETVKGQLISGRSSISDVMNAEVTLAETQIDLVNARADAVLLSYQIFALTGSLAEYIGWSD